MNVKEIFGPTIQGEGIHAGEICSFIRFAGCDQNPICKWCDTLEAYNKDSGIDMKPENIVDKLSKNINKVILTGGNPCIQYSNEMELLITLLKDNSYKIYIETQGTVFPEWLYKLDHITISPKPPSAYSNKQFGQKIDCIKKFIEDYYTKVFLYMIKNKSTIVQFPTLEIKIVVFTKKDLEYALKIFNEIINKEDIESKIAISKQFYIIDINSVINKYINYTIQVGTDIHNDYITYNIEDEIIKHSRGMDLQVGYLFNIRDTEDDIIDEVDIYGWSESGNGKINYIKYTLHNNNDNTLFEIDISDTQTIKGKIDFKKGILSTDKLDKDITMHYNIVYTRDNRKEKERQKLTTNDIIDSLPKELISKIRILPQIHRMLEVQ